MALSQVDKIKITGNITKNQILEFNDIVVDSKSGATVDDYLDFVISFYEKKIETNSKEKLIYKCLMAIEVTVAEYIYNSYSMSDEFKEKLVNLKNIYFEYVNRNSLKLNEDIIRKLGEINNDIINHVLTNASPEDESNIIEFSKDKREDKEELLSNALRDLTVAQMRNEELEKNLKQTKKEVTSFKRKLTNKDKSYDKQAEAFKVTTTKLLDATKKGQTLESENKKLKSELDSLREENEKNERAIQTHLDELKKTKDEQTLLSNKLNELTKKTNALESSKTIDEEILKLLAKSPHTIEEIKVELSLSKIRVTDMDVLDSIKRLNSFVNISANSMRNFSPVYEICSPLVKKYRTTNLDVNVNSCLDILLVSDVHITHFDDNILRLYDMVNEYAINNNIGLVLDLGDLFDFSNNLNKLKEKEERIKKINEIVVTTATSLPKCEEVNRAILGGNHDASALRRGIDPIELFTSNRVDTINLGYNLANLKLGNNSVLIHHPNNIRIKNFPDKDNETGYNIIDYVTKSASLLGIRLEDEYINFFGHFHKNCIDSDGYVSVPSLNKDRITDGAMHLKIYFDENKNISNIVIVSVIKANNKLIKSSEVVYKKRTLEK